MMPSPTNPTLLICVSPSVLFVAVRVAALSGFPNRFAHPRGQVRAAGGEQVNVAADRDEGEAGLEVAPCVGLHAGEDASRLAGGADALAGPGDRGLDLGVAGIAEVAEVGGEI